MNQPHGKGIVSEKNHEPFKMSRLVEYADRAYYQRGNQDKIRPPPASQQKTNKNDYERVWQMQIFGIDHFEQVEFRKIDSGDED